MPSRYGRYKPTLRGLVGGGVVIGVAVLAYAILAPPAPGLATEPQPQAAQANAGGGATPCQQSRLAALRNAAERAAIENACADGAARAKAEEAASRDARSTKAAEDSAWQAYYQARSAAFQSALAVLVLGASAAAAWAAFQAAHYARYAAVETRRGAKASERALRHDQKIDEVQVRPYVYIFGESVEVKEAVPGIVSDHANILFCVKNYGQTPAKSVRIRAKAYVGGYWNEETDTDLSDAQPVERADLPPGFHRQIDGYSLGGLAEADAAILRDERSIIFYGLIEYTDAAGSKYTTEFRRACTGQKYKEGIFFIPRDGNHAT